MQTNALPVDLYAVGRYHGVVGLGVDTPDAMPDRSILLVDPSHTNPDELIEAIDESTEHPVITGTDLDTARTRLASNPIDCLLLTIDPSDDTGRHFVGEARTIAPDTPLILLTTQGPESVSEELLSQVTTIVEQADDPDRWAFLAE